MFREAGVPDFDKRSHSAGPNGDFFALTWPDGDAQRVKLMAEIIEALWIYDGMYSRPSASPLMIYRCLLRHGNLLACAYCKVHGVMEVPLSSPLWAVHVALVWSGWSRCQVQIWRLTYIKTQMLLSLFLTLRP
jgi:hypothetical protein